MNVYKVTLRGTLILDDIEAENEDDAYEKAMEMAEGQMIHDILDDGDVEKIK